MAIIGLFEMAQWALYKFRSLRCAARLCSRHCGQQLGGGSSSTALPTRGESRRKNCRSSSVTGNSPAQIAQSRYIPLYLIPQSGPDQDIKKPAAFLGAAGQRCFFALRRSKNLLLSSLSQIFSVAIPWSNPAPSSFRNAPDQISNSVII